MFSVKNEQYLFNIEYKFNIQGKSQCKEMQLAAAAVTHAHTQHRLCFCLVLDLQLFYPLSN